MCWELTGEPALWSFMRQPVLLEKADWGCIANMLGRLRGLIELMSHQPRDIKNTGGKWWWGSWVTWGCSMCWDLKEGTPLLFHDLVGKGQETLNACCIILYCVSESLFTFLSPSFYLLWSEVCEMLEQGWSVPHYMYQTLQLIYLFIFLPGGAICPSVKIFGK